MQYPTVYFQIKKLKKIWQKYGGEDSEEVIKLFDEKLKEIEKEMKLHEEV